MTHDAGDDYVATIYGNGAHYFAVRNVNSQWYRVDSLHQSPIPITHRQYMEWMQQGYLRVIRRPQGLTDSDMAGNLRRLHMPSSHMPSSQLPHCSRLRIRTLLVLHATCGSLWASRLAFNEAKRLFRAFFGEVVLAIRAAAEAESPDGLWKAD